jgi:hypothetical protein
MHTAAQVSIGGRRQIKEDGNDVCDSQSDSENEEHGEELTGMYTSEIPIGKDGRPVDSGLCRVTPGQASAQRAAATRCSEEFKGPPHRHKKPLILVNPPHNPWPCQGRRLL